MESKMDSVFYDIYVAHTYAFLGTVSVPKQGNEHSAIRAVDVAAEKIDCTKDNLVALESDQLTFLRRGI